ncbi:MAG: hypothetical protein ACRDFS_12765 [Chloroflexota bacterium]
MIRRARRELISSVVGTLLGLVALAYAIFGPIYTQYTDSTSAQRSAWQSGVASQGLALEVAVGLAFIIASLAAYYHAVQGRTIGLVVLAAAALLAWAYTLAGIASIGLFFVPGSVALTVSVVYGLRWAARG